MTSRLIPYSSSRSSQQCSVSPLRRILTNPLVQWHPSAKLLRGAQKAVVGHVLPEGFGSDPQEHQDRLQICPYAYITSNEITTNPRISHLPSPIISQYTTASPTKSQRLPHQLAYSSRFSCSRPPPNDPPPAAKKRTSSLTIAFRNLPDYQIIC